MKEHVHFGILTALVVFLSLLPLSYLWRLIALKNADKPWGQAMALIW